MLKSEERRRENTSKESCMKEKEIAAKMSPLEERKKKKSQ